LAQERNGIKMLTSKNETIIRAVEMLGCTGKMRVKLA
jgi:hypothetical protein